MSEQPVAEQPAVSDERFMRNVREALENGYDLCCAYCGAGFFDGSEGHDRACPEYRSPI